MSEYCTECGAHENEWGKGPVMDELTDTISRLQALLKRALASVEDDIEDLRDDGHADCDDSCAGYREWVGLSALLADIDAELRRGGEMTDPVARALACVDAEADKRAAEMEYDTSKGAVGSTAAIGIGQVHAKLVYRAHLERALRALSDCADALGYARRCILNEAEGGGRLREVAPDFARIDKAWRVAAACFPPEREEET